MFCARSQRPLRPALLPPLCTARRARQKQRQPLAELVNLWYVGLNGNAVSRDTLAAYSVHILCIGQRMEGGTIRRFPGTALHLEEPFIVYGVHQTRRTWPPRLSADLFSLSRQSSLLPSEISEKAAKPVPQPVARLVHAPRDNRFCEHRRRTARRRGRADGSRPHIDGIKNGRYQPRFAVHIARSIRRPWMRGHGSPARAQTPVLRPEKARRPFHRQKEATSHCISYQSRVYWSHQKRRQQRCARCVNRSFRPS